MIEYGKTWYLYSGARLCNLVIYELTYEPLNGPTPAVTLYVKIGAYSVANVVWTTLT